MKLRFICFALVASFMSVCFSACHKDVVQTDPRLDFVEWTWDEFLREGVSAVALTDVFDQYQKIRSDREAGMALVKKYFSPDFLYYDSMKSYSLALGKVVLQEDGSYLVSAEHNRGWIGLSICHNIKVSVTSDHHYHISAVKGNPDSYHYDERNKGFEDYRYKHECDAYVENDKITFTNLEFSYTHPYSQYMVKVSCLGESFSIGMPQNDKIKFYPSEGSLRFEYKCTGSFNNAPWTGLPEPCTVNAIFTPEKTTLSDGKGYEKIIENKPTFHSYYYL